MESYFDLAMCALLNMLAFAEKVNGEYKFYQFWSTSDDILCSVLTIIYTVFLIGFPVYGHIQILKYLGSLHKPEHVETIGVFYEDNRINTKWRAMYNIIFLQRRLLTVLVLIYIETTPFF
jgi:hypothetical protein